MKKYVLLAISLCTLLAPAQAQTRAFAEREAAKRTANFEQLLTKLKVSSSMPVTPPMLSALLQGFDRGKQCVADNYFPQWVYPPGHWAQSADALNIPMTEFAVELVRGEYLEARWGGVRTVECRFGNGSRAWGVYYHSERLIRLAWCEDGNFDFLRMTMQHETQHGIAFLFGLAQASQIGHDPLGPCWAD